MRSRDIKDPMYLPYYPSISYWCLPLAKSNRKPEGKGAVVIKSVTTSLLKQSRAEKVGLEEERKISSTGQTIHWLWRCQCTRQVGPCPPGVYHLAGRS